MGHEVQQEIKRQKRARPALGNVQPEGAETVATQLGGESCGAWRHAVGVSGNKGEQEGTRLWALSGLTVGVKCTEVRVVEESSLSRQSNWNQKYFQ